MIWFIALTVVCILLQSTEPPVLDMYLSAILETTFDCVFAVEFLVRFFTCPSPGLFMFNAFNLIDLAACAPLVLRIQAGWVLDPHQDSTMQDVIIALTPCLRLMKSLRRFQKFHLIFSAFTAAFEALPVLLWTLLLTTLVFAATIFLIEPRDNIQTLPKAMWLAIVTMTTVGYGDVTPVTGPGYAVVALVIVTSVLYMAMPLGLIGHSFTAIWKDRDRILLMNQTRKKMLQWGYTAQDIPVLFNLFDEDDTGELEIGEFMDMISAMRIGLSEERAFQLFEAFDVDGSGTIDDEEFVRFVFPHTFHGIYAAQYSETRHENPRRKRSRGLSTYSMRSSLGVQDLKGVGAVFETPAARRENGVRFSTAGRTAGIRQSKTVEALELKQLHDLGKEEDSQAQAKGKADQKVSSYALTSTPESDNDGDSTKGASSKGMLPRQSSFKIRGMEVEVERSPDRLGSKKLEDVPGKSSSFIPKEKRSKAVVPGEIW
jgi:voltage-gated potassium channel